MRRIRGIVAVLLVSCGGGSTPSPNAASSVDSTSTGATTSGASSPSTPTQIDCGDFHNCARMGDATVRCWGRDRDGELGDGGDSGDSTKPRTVEGVNDVAQVAVGSSFSCVRFNAGSVSCWGSGKILGDGKDVTKQRPTPVAGLRDVVDLEAGGYVACARLSSGAAKCWGLAAVDKGGPSSGVAQVSAAGAHACALDKTGAVQCWGEGAWAPGATTSFSKPPVTAAKAISSGDSFACVLSGAGAVSCFGRNEQGELGANPDEDNHVKPVPVRAVDGATAIASAESHSCAVLKSGALTCWGSNTEGELGRGTTTTQELAGVVGGVSDVVAVAPGADHVCARTANGSVYCWGNNKYGQIGDGTNEARLTPVRIAF